MKAFLIFLAAVVLSSSPGLADGPQPANPAKTDKCPVCGMFVAKYPDFVAQVAFKDGTNAFFDGAKDMFKCYLNLKRYEPSRDLFDIAAVYVTDYYGMTPTDGREAWYVIGSNVYGPMGKELIPFAREEDAREFMADNGGKELVRFDAVTPEMVRELD
jgi:copper chaperone NosL